MFPNGPVYTRVPSLQHSLTVKRNVTN